MSYNFMDHIKTELTGEEINVNGITPAMIFQSLNTNVLTVGQFKTDLLARENNLQSTQVNQLLQSYGY